MKLLVVKDTAGAITPIVDWLTARGHQSRVIEHPSADIFDLTSYSENAIMQDCTYRAVIRQLKELRPTVIHINTHHHLIPFIRLFAPFTPIVFMYHGSEIRERAKYGLSHTAEAALADKIIVSTPDLGEFGEWFDRPIPEYFRYTGGREPNTALMFYAEYFAVRGKDKRDLARAVCRRLGLKLTIREGRNKFPIPNYEMPIVYSFFEFFLDFKGHDTKDTFAVSKSAMEANRCGCKVLHDIDPYRVLDMEGSNDLFERYRRLYDGLGRASLAKGLVRWIKSVVLIVLTPHKHGGYQSQNRFGKENIVRLVFYLSLFVRRMFWRTMWGCLNEK